MFNPQPYPLYAFKGEQGPELVLGWIYEDGRLTALLENGERVDDYNPGQDGEEVWTLTPDKSEAEEQINDAIKSNRYRRLAVAA